MTSFAKAVREARQRLGLSQRAIAAAVGLDYTYISKIECDRTDYTPKPDAIRRLAEVLGMDGDRLLQLAGILPDEAQREISALYAVHGDEFLDWIKQFSGGDRKK